ncbi:hypothetical protein [Natrarchaeobaculum sulfurireducens]|uniref:Uncharacterized protein n=1 Tax=Natrarchaeobaculum sulfurireducens TaxID=2044521 RepID=A0A346P9E3_9EURY|nr:hypothetical protein [Natrarchaeobaculum sulfurireducens]AXR76138.1 hypothetical protein AArc1_4021 [Natrarchaeobaculum sulfurireducens]
MQSRSITLEEIDELFLKWNDHINASALFRQALKEEMRVRDIDPHEFRDLFKRAEEQGYEFEEVLEQTNRIDDLERLVEGSVASTRSTRTD